MPLKIENPNGPCFSDYTKKLGVVWKFWYKYRLSRNAGWLVPRVADAHCSAQTAYWLTTSKAMLLCHHPLHDLSFATCCVALHDLGAFDTDKTTHRAPIGLAPSRGFPTTRPTHFQTVCCLAAVVTKKPRWNNKQVDRLWNSVTV